MIEHDEELVDIGRRIELLTLEPEAIVAPLTRLFSPILYRVGWRPKTTTAAIEALVTRIARRGLVELYPLDRRGPEPAPVTLLRAAIAELEGNLVQVERATVITKRPLIAHAAWLRRLYELVINAGRSLERQEDLGARALAGLTDRARLLPPLAMRHHDASARVDPSHRGEGEGGGDPARLLELQLDTVDHLLAAAREEDARLGRRRQLLSAARQLLLESSAALELEEDGVHQRLQSIAEQITRVNRYEAAGLSPDVALLHQARAALSRGERDRLFAVLSVLRRGAVERGDAEAVGVASEAVERLLGQVNRDALQAASLARSADEMFGAAVTRAIEEGYARGRALERSESDVELNQYTIDALKEYYAPGRERATLANALAVDGCFEVGGALSPVRVQEQFVRHRLVPYPTQTMKLVRATQPEDIPTSLITDPRAIIMDLAAGRLLTRRHLQDDIATRTRTVMRGEVRVYVLDGSSSMIGPRARMRDAILTAELATLIKRMENPRANARVVLYYRYFTRALSDTRRVDSVASAIEAIRDVTGTARTGGTNIERALLASMTMINEARERDPELACGQIVLITDGDAPVAETRVRQARAALDVPVGISVIALGEENHALRRLVAAQRKQGERAFYHFLPDAYLARVSAGEIDDELAVHVGRRPALGERVAPMPEDLQVALGELVEQLGDLQRCREAEARRELDRANHDARGRRDEPTTAPSRGLVGEGQRARLEALYNDDMAVQRRFRRWFPSPRAPAPEAALQHLPPQPGTLERDDLDAVIVVLATVADVVEAVGATPTGRMADAVDLLDRLLPNARLTPTRYHEILRLYPGEVAAALQAVHGTTRSGLGWRIDNLPQRFTPLLSSE